MLNMLDVSSCLSHYFPFTERYIWINKSGSFEKLPKWLMKFSSTMECTYVVQFWVINRLISLDNDNAERLIIDPVNECMMNLTACFVGYDIWFSVKWNMHDWWVMMHTEYCHRYLYRVVCRHNFFQTQINLSSIGNFKPNIFQLIFGFRNALKSAMLG